MRVPRYARDPSSRFAEREATRHDARARARRRIAEGTRNFSLKIAWAMPACENSFADDADDATEEHSSRSADRIDRQIDKLLFQ